MTDPKDPIVAVAEFRFADAARMSSDAAAAFARGIPVLARKGPLPCSHCDGRGYFDQGGGATTMCRACDGVPFGHE